MEYRELFKPELTEVAASYSSQEEMFRQIGYKLVEGGFVKESFSHAVIVRERKYPTGLEVGTMTVAIPHTDVEHIKEPFVYVVKLTVPLEFIKMGTTDERLAVSSVFILGIKDPKGQVGLLSGFIELLNNQVFVEDFNRANRTVELFELIKNNFRSE